MPWRVVLHEGSDPEYVVLPSAVQDAIATASLLLRDYRPLLGRPHVDRLAGSRHANMKELRFRAEGGAWRVAFAFDPERQAVLLIAGDKAGIAQKRFYQGLIARADTRFDAHVAKREQ